MTDLAKETRQRKVAEALWTTMTLAYRDPQDRSGNPVLIPTREAIGALLTVVANIIAEVPDARERHHIIALASPVLERAVRQGRRMPDLTLPANQGIVLPN